MENGNVRPFQGSEPSMMNQQTLESRLAGLPLGGLRYYESIGSTNDAAADWAGRGAVDYSLVIADEQTKGRGRAGRKWFTYPGTGLAFSLILRPSPKEVKELNSLSTRFTGLGALAVSQVLRCHYLLPAQIKWPNDVLVNRRKICGILAEAHWNGDRLSTVILGIGINIATNAIPLEGTLIFPATSLAQEAKHSVDRTALLYKVLAEIIRWRADLLDEKFLQAWETNLAYRDEWVRITVSNQQEHVPDLLYTGWIQGLNPDGTLRLQTQSGDEIVLQQGELSQLEDDIQLRPVDRS
jgi:BirA family biotin operon repressor/biotin-[acetyl-CoA-carboxylase] ligase